MTSGLLNALVAEQLPGPGSVFLEVSWRFLAPVRPGDVITAEATVTGAREDKPVTTLATAVTNQDGVTVLDGTAVVWRDPDGRGRGHGEGRGKASLLASVAPNQPMPNRRHHQGGIT